MHQSHLRVIGVIAHVIPQMIGNRIDQRAVKIATPRVYHHTSTLVDHENLLVLIHNVQRNILGYNSPITLRSVQHKRHHIASLHPVIALYSLAPHHNKASLSSLLDTIATRVAQVVHQKLVHTHRILPGICHYTAMLVEFLQILSVSQG